MPLCIDSTDNHPFILYNTSINKEDCASEVDTQ